MAEAQIASPHRAREYETIYVLKPDVTRETQEKIATRLEEVVGREGGKLTQVDNWGRRKFAYEMHHLNEGFYALATVQAEPQAMDELDRVLRLQDELVRHKITRPGKD